MGDKEERKYYSRGNHFCFVTMEGTQDGAFGRVGRFGMVNRVDQEGET